MSVKPSAQNRLLCAIAEDIEENWANVNYAAKPYLAAMHRLNHITDRFHEDDAETVVLYFLSNAKGWRGEESRRIKAELKAMLG